MPIFSLAIKTVIFGFISAGIASRVNSHLLKFRTNWTSLFSASFLVNIICGATEWAFIGFLNPRDDNFMLKALLGTIAVAYSLGVPVCWFIVKSRSGRDLGFARAVVTCAVMVAPSAAIGALLVGTFYLAK